MSVTTNLVIAALGLSTLGGAAYKAGEEKDVNVVNTPTVNVATMPSVVVQDLREPVFFFMEANLVSNTTYFSDEAAFLVPEGKRLVVTHVSGIANTNDRFPVTGVKITAGPDGENPHAFHQVVPFASPQSVETDLVVTTYSQPMNLVATSGQRVGGSITRAVSHPDYPGYGNMCVSGYLEPAP